MSYLHLNIFLYAAGLPKFPRTPEITLLKNTEYIYNHLN